MTESPSKACISYMLISLDVAGPITNILVVRQEIDPSNRTSSNLQASTKKNGSYLLPPLEKYANSTDSDLKTAINLGDSRGCMDVSYNSSNVISNHIKELQVCVSP
jgi:pre-rRNA-processing protein IPI3